MEFKDTQTAGNLAKAFAGESQARNRYTYYAATARQEGLEHVANIFIETAENERAHAEIFFNHLLVNMGEGVAVVDGTYPVGKKTTADNLRYAAAGEREEWEVLYQTFADIAEEEGFKQVAISFRQIASVEVQHENRYLELLALVENGKFFSRDEEKEWKCINCGYIYVGKEPLNICPTCKYPKAFWEIKICEH